MAESVDYRFMSRALELARHGLETTDPNPRVGCVIVNEGRIVGEGWHRRVGEAHAEVLALAAAGESARGATAYVTLEPCCHQGRTPPCTGALIGAGLNRVVCAFADPDPRVSGKGIETLTAAGIKVSTGVLSATAEALNVGYCSRHRRGRPFVRLKLGTTLDGRIAMRSGESRWITSKQARADVHRLRARSSAILTGSGTVLADDPLLTVQSGNDCNELRQPLRVVLDSTLRLPSTARLMAQDGATLILTTSDDPAAARSLEAAGAEVMQIEGAREGVDLRGVVAELARRQINEVLVEAGPRLGGSLVNAGLVDELVIYLAPSLIGTGGRGMIDLPGLTQLVKRPQLRLTDIRRIGPDVRITAQPVLETD